MFTFTIFGLVFLTLGIILFVMSDKITELTFSYDKEQIEADGYSYVNVAISEVIPAPVYLYY